MECINIQTLAGLLCAWKRIVSVIVEVISFTCAPLVMMYKMCVVPGAVLSITFSHIGAAKLFLFLLFLSYKITSVNK